MTTEATASEVHISSLVVLCKTEYLERAAAAIKRDSIAEIHAVDQSGKMVVVLETLNEGNILDSINSLEAIEGVISATLVYHQGRPLRSKKKGI